MKESDTERYIAAEELLLGASLSEETNLFLLDLIPDIEREQRIIEEYSKWKRATIEARWEA